jgi:molecular chaperone GrpE
MTSEVQKETNEAMTTTQEDLENASTEAKAGAQSEAKVAGEGATTEAATEANKAAAEVTEMKDKYLRLMAEFDNFRRRTAKENMELIATANAKLIGKLTEVLDNFDLAFDPKNKGASPEDFEKGVRLIQVRFKQLLEDEGLEAIDPQGQTFDPNLHEALLEQPSPTVPENHVVTVVQKGWKLKSKILKHARVIVSRGQD